MPDRYSVMILCSIKHAGLRFVDSLAGYERDTSRSINRIEDVPFYDDVGVSSAT